MDTDHRISRKPFQTKTRFMRSLRASLSHHYTLGELWSYLLGDAIPSPVVRQALIDLLNSQGWKVDTRDFIRSTAASNHPLFINLRLLRHSLDRDTLELTFFDDRHHKKGHSNADQKV